MDFSVSAEEVDQSVIVGVDGKVVNKDHACRVQAVLQVRNGGAAVDRWLSRWNGAWLTSGIVSGEARVRKVAELDNEGVVVAHALQGQGQCEWRHGADRRLTASAVWQWLRTQN